LLTRLITILLCCSTLLYQCLFACIFLHFLIFCFSLQVHLSLLLLSWLCIFVLFFCCALSSVSYFDSMNYASSVYFSSYPQHAISSLFCVFILSVHLLRSPCIVLLHALHRATVLLIGLFTVTPLFLCFARSSLKRKNDISLLSIPHLLLISNFYLTLRILLVSHCAYCNFSFLTVQLIFSFKTANHAQSLRVSFIHYNPFSYPSNIQENASSTESPTVQES
jgi:hypothetical protein